MKIGDHAVWQSAGPVRLFSHKDGVLTFKSIDFGAFNEGMRYVIPEKELALVARPLVAPDEAERIVALLRSTNGYPYQRADEQLSDDCIARARNVATEVAMRLHRYYRSSYDEGWKFMGAAEIERAVIGELALVLGEEWETLRTRLREGHPSLLPRAGKRPADPPRVRPTAPAVVPEFLYAGSFESLDGRLRINSVRPEENTAIVARPGTWHVWEPESAPSSTSTRSNPR